MISTVLLPLIMTTTSIEDKRFLEFMEKGIHKNKLGNWELPQSSSKTTTSRQTRFGTCRTSVYTTQKTHPDSSGL